MSESNPNSCADVGDTFRLLAEAAKGGDVDSLWGVAPIAPLHLGYDPLVVAQRQLIAAGARHTIIIADQHAMMSHGLSYPEVRRRAAYYQAYFSDCCQLGDVCRSGTSFQSSEGYIALLYAVLSKIPVSHVKQSLAGAAKNVGADVQTVGAYIYGVMQCLDPIYLAKSLLVSEPGQRKIHDLLAEVHRLAGLPVAARELPRELYVEAGIDIRGLPLNRSSARDRISIHESSASLRAKVQAMYAPPFDQPLGEGRVNALLHYFRWSAFPWTDEPVEVTDEGGIVLTIRSYDEFIDHYGRGQLHPSSCKQSLGRVLARRLARYRRILGTALTAWVNEPLTRGVPA